jgi:imidazole glycerol phosphate synthase subunit HisF
MIHGLEIDAFEEHKNIQKIYKIVDGVAVNWMYSGGIKIQSNHYYLLWFGSRKVQTCQLFGLTI